MKIVIENKIFTEILSNADIDKRLFELADLICEDYKLLNPIFVSVLNGSFLFASNLVQKCTIEYEITFIKMKSYSGIYSTGQVVELIGIDCSFEDRHIIIVEDIVESGITTSEVVKKMKLLNPKSIAIASLLFKPQKLIFKDIPLKYVGFEIMDQFVVGYGLDINGKGRNLLSIYQLNK